MKYIHLWSILAALIAFSSHAHAQDDFFNRGGVGLFEPEIGFVATGAQIVVGPTVSADRKYVTIGVGRAQASRVIRIDDYPFITGGFAGPVGNAQPAAAAARGAQFAEAMNASVPVTVRVAAAGGTVLNQTGMTRIQ